MLEELVKQLKSNDASAQQHALTLVAYIFDASRGLLSESLPPEAQSVAADHQKVQQLKHALCEWVRSSQPTDSVSTAIWALGKLYDRSLIPLFVETLRWGTKANSAFLYQSLIALSNLGEIRLPASGVSLFDRKSNEAIAREYLVDE